MSRTKKTNPESPPQTFYVVREGSTEADGARKLGEAYKFILECLAKKDSENAEKDTKSSSAIAS